MSKILIVSRDISLKQDGGTLVSMRNERLLQQLGFETTRFIVPIPSMMTRLKNILFRQSYGETKSLLKKFQQVLNNKYDYIFFDGSIYGGFVKIANRSKQNIISFYHNVEVEYYRQKANQTKSVLDKLMVPYIKYNEKLATQNSTWIINLNNRDSITLNSIYGRYADLILPTSLPANDLASLYAQYSPTEDPYLLFVGTNFFANVEGLKRFLYNIAPKVNVKILVAGNINDAFSNLDRRLPNVYFLGKVDNLEQYYIGASAIITPIFTGSGLKTKTVEALSYGKTIIGFEEAFEGIEHTDYASSCIQVTTDSDFISAINKLNLSNRYNPESERLFKDKLSDEAQLKKFRFFFDKIRNNGNKAL